MASQLRVDKSENRSGLGTITYTDTGAIVSGIVTANSFEGDLTGDVTGTASNASGATGDFSIADKIIHTGDTNTALRFPTADTITAETGGSERLRIDSSGNVGIGLTNPQSNTNLHIKAATVNQLRLETTNNTSYGMVKFVEGDHDGTKDKYIIGYNDSHSAQADEFSMKNQVGDITFMTGGVATTDERLRIDSGGKILAGTTSSRAVAGGYAKLQVEAASSEGISLTRTTNDGGASYFSFGKVRGSSVCQAGDTIGAISWNPSDGTDLNHAAAEILTLVASGIGGNDVPGDLVFKTNGGTTTTTERLRIDSNGKVIVATGQLHSSRVLARFGIDCHGMDIYDDVGVVANYGMAFYNDPTSNKANGIGFFNDDGQTCGGYIVHQDKGGSNIGDLIFGTASTANTPVERMRIKTSGEVNIGTVGGNSTYLAIAQNAGLDVWGDGSAYPTLRLGTEVYQTEGEDIRFGRSDHGPADIRYHSITSRHDSSGGGNALWFKLHDAGSSPYTSQKTALKLDGLGRVAVNGASCQHDNKLTVRSDNASQSGANEGSVSGALAMFYGGARSTISGTNYLDTGSIHIKGQITDTSSASSGTHKTGRIVFSGRRRYGAQAWIEHFTEWNYSTQNAGSHLKFFTAGLASNGGDDSTPGCRLHINKEGKLLHGSGLVSQVYGGGTSIGPGVTKTFTISGLISGSFMFQAGTYGAAGANQGGISFVASGYMTASWTYDVHEIDRWSNGGGTGMAINAVGKNASNCTFTMVNSHGSYTAGVSWHLWGNDEITVTVS